MTLELDNLSPTPSAPELVSLLLEQATRHPDSGYTFLEDGEREAARLSFSALLTEASALASQLQWLDIKGERALLLYPPGLEFITAFFGCLLAGVVAVPAYPPDPTRLERSLGRLKAISDDSQARIILTTSELVAYSDELTELAPWLEHLPRVATDRLDLSHASLWKPEHIRPDTLAFLQYTSGSTGIPKGVMISHRNLLHNEQIITAGFRRDRHSIGVGWLPMFHDMGLIGNVIQPLYTGASVYLMSPLDFLRRPMRWLEAVSRLKAHTSGGPNFAYDLCVRHAKPEEIGRLDLRSWQVAFNGAEPVRAETLKRFAETFAPAGFAPEAFYPCYGLAEATLMVTGASQRRSPTTLKVSAAALEIGHVQPTEEEDARALVSSGDIMLDQQVRIVSPDTGLPCPPSQVGEIWVSGSSVAQGYWQRPEESRQTFGATLEDAPGRTWLRTGDLGFLYQQELFVTGRLKDLIIIRGRNHYPQDIEASVERASSLIRPGCSVAFSVDHAGDERLVVVAEVDVKRQRSSLEDLAGEVRAAISRDHELRVHAVVLLPPRALPKTSSGKVQRRACRQAYLEGALETLGTDIAEEQTEPAQADTLDASQLRALELVEREARILLWLQAFLGSLAGVPGSSLSPDRPLASLGIDSLGAVHLQQQVSEVLGTQCSLLSLLGGQTIQHLASQLAGSLEPQPSNVSQPLENQKYSPAHRATDSAQPLARSPSASVDRTPETGSALAEQPERAIPLERSWPLSRGQRALWLLQEIAPESSAYNLATASNVFGTLDESAIQEAFQRLLARHPQLRARFIDLEVGGRQTFLAPKESALCTIAAQEWTEDALDAHLVTEAHRPFDLKKDAPCRLTLYRRATGPSVLLLVVHHAVADLWSLALLARDLDQLYRSALDGSPGNLPPPPASFEDFVRWQESQLEGPEGNRLSRYWRQTLAGAPPFLPLPTDFARPRAPHHDGAVEPFVLEADLSLQVLSLAERLGVTPFVVTLAAFSLLMHRLSQQPDVLIGCPSSGRGLLNQAETVGYFVNPLVIRSRLTASLSGLELVEQTRSQVLGALDHQGLPFMTLVEQLNPPRDPVRSPLFQVMFAWQRSPLASLPGLTGFALGMPGARLALGELALEHRPLPQRVAQFELSMALGEEGGQLRGTLEYAVALYRPETVRRILAGFAQILRGLVGEPTQRVWEISYLPDRLRRVISEWGQGLDFPVRDRRAAQTEAGEWEEADQDATLHGLISAQADRTPEALALIVGEKSLTYGMLQTASERLARTLKARGAGPEQVIGVCLERSPELLVALLGILKSGAAYLPLDPTYPPERLKYMLEASQVRLIITAPGLIQPGLTAATLLTVAELDQELAECKGETTPTTAATADNLACLIFTSGTTGRPRGVMLEHRGIVNLVGAFAQSYAATAQDRMLPLTSPAFASFVGEVFPLLTLGGAVVLPTSEEVLQYEALFELMSRHQVSMVSTVPAVLAQLNARQAALPQLRLLLSGGEALSPNDIQQLRSSVLISNSYGLTETTVCSTFHTLEREEAGAEAVPIGRPLPHTRAWVLDQALQPVMPGMPGELYLGGAGLARGYLAQAGLTASRFVPDPFCPGQRLYRTGDVARWREDGVLEYLQRADTQIKLRGFRIEPAEIEQALLAQPGIRQALVLDTEVPGAGKVLVAFVTALEGAAPDGEALRQRLKARLPEYMVPTAVLLMPELPLTAHGKVDREGLRARGAQEARSEVARGRVFSQPGTALETRIATEWAKVLGLERVGITENFFDLGGHSLLLAQVHSSLKASFPGLTLVDLFRYPTVQALARHLAGPTEGTKTGGDDLRARANARRQAQAQRRRG